MLASEFILRKGLFLAFWNGCHFYETNVWIRERWARSFLSGIIFFLPANIILQQKWNNTAVSQKEGGGTFSSS